MILLNPPGQACMATIKYLNRESQSHPRLFHGADGPSHFSFSFQSEGYCSFAEPSDSPCWQLSILFSTAPVKILYVKFVHSPNSGINSSLFSFNFHYLTKSRKVERCSSNLGVFSSNMEISWCLQLNHMTAGCSKEALKTPLPLHLATCCYLCPYRVNKKNPFWGMCCLVFPGNTDFPQWAHACWPILKWRGEIQ